MVTIKKTKLKPNKKWCKAVNNHFKITQEEFSIYDQQGVQDLTLACDALQRIHASEQIVEKEGLTIMTRFNEVRAHPLLNVIRDNHQLYLRTIKSLGLLSDENQSGVGKPYGSERV